MTTPTDTRPELLTVIAHMKAAPGKEQDLRPALEALVEPASREKGFVDDDLHQSVSDAGTFYLDENRESEEDLDVHLSAPHLVEFAGRLGDLLDDDGLRIDRLRRTA